MVARELYLEGIPAAELEAELVERAIRRTDRNIAAMELALAAMRAKQVARQRELARQAVRRAGGSSARPPRRETLGKSQPKPVAAPDRSNCADALRAGSSAGPSTGSDAPAPGGAKPDETPLTPAVVAHLRDWCLRSLQGEISAPRPGGQEKEGA